MMFFPNVLLLSKISASLIKSSRICWFRLEENDLFLRKAFWVVVCTPVCHLFVLETVEFLINWFVLLSILLVTYLRWM